MPGLLPAGQTRPHMANFSRRADGLGVLDQHSMKNKVVEFIKCLAEADACGIQAIWLIDAANGRQKDFGDQCGMKRTEATTSDAILNDLLEHLCTLPLVILEKFQSRLKLMQIKHELTACLRGFGYTRPHKGRYPALRPLLFKRCNPPKMPDTPQPAVHDNEDQIMLAWRQLIERPLRTSETLGQLVYRNG